MRLTEVELSGALSSSAHCLADGSSASPRVQGVIRSVPHGWLLDITLFLQVEWSGAASSQYLTTLLRAAPLPIAQEGIAIKIRDELAWQPYMDTSVRLMERFGIQVLHLKSGNLFSDSEAGHYVKIM